jgi:transposase
VVDGYKQLWQIERVFRDLKHVVDIRPVFHRKGDRIRAHVLLCWLALVLIRVVERDTEMTWSKIQQALYPLQAGLCQNRTFSFSPTTALTPEQKAIFAKLQLDPPPTMLHLTRREA